MIHIRNITLESDVRNGRKAEVLGKVAPSRIDGVDQILFERPGPALDLLFATDGARHRLVLFEPQQSLDGLTTGESVGMLLAMLVDALHKLGRDAGVECALRRPHQQINARLPHPAREEGDPRGLPDLLRGAAHGL